MISRVGSVEVGIDVVVLNEITVSCTQEVDCTREYGIGFVSSHHIYNFRLVLLVIVQLLCQ